MLLEGIDQAPKRKVDEAFRGEDGNVYWRHDGKTFMKDSAGNKQEIPENQYIAAKSQPARSAPQAKGRTNINTTDDYFDKEDFFDPEKDDPADFHPVYRRGGDDS
jgi:hypothetical protein